MAPAPMPDKYIVEMLMDRIAACKVYHGEDYTTKAPLAYYELGKDMAPLHKVTRKKLEFLLHMLADKGEDYTFRYIRKRILKK